MQDCTNILCRHKLYLYLIIIELKLKVLIKNLRKFEIYNDITRLNNILGHLLAFLTSSWLRYGLQIMAKRQKESKISETNETGFYHHTDLINFIYRLIIYLNSMIFFCRINFSQKSTCLRKFWILIFEKRSICHYFWLSLDEKW